MPGGLEAGKLGGQEAWMPGGLDAGKLERHEGGKVRSWERRGWEDEKVRSWEGEKVS